MIPDFFYVMDNIIYKNTLETPIGYLEFRTNRDYLLSIRFTDIFVKSSDYQPEIMNESMKQITEYFKGERKEFNLKLDPNGTDFQLMVWEEVKKVPFGKTATYLDIAKQTGSLKNTRAVGLANGKNPIPIIIPCHRIIGTNGKLTGYAGGLERKKWLLQHELKHSLQTDLLF